MGEVGIVAPQGGQHAYRLKRLAEGGHDEQGEIVVPDRVRASLAPRTRQIDAIDGEIAAIDEAIKAGAKGDETAKRLTTIPGLAPLTASALDCAQCLRIRQRPRVRRLARPDAPAKFERRQGAARAHHQNGRPLLAQVAGGRRQRRHRPRRGAYDALRRWVKDLLARKSGPTKRKLAALALANKLVRIAFALLAAGGRYDDRPVAAAA